MPTRSGRGLLSVARFIEARLDEEADSARRCDGDGRGEWSAHGHTVDFCQVDLAGFHPTIAHVALYDPVRVLREIQAKRRILARHARDPWPCHDLRDLASPSPTLLTSRQGPEAAKHMGRSSSKAARPGATSPRKILTGQNLG
ncbi:DUF6221 family protein [Streptomyces sp. CS131]|uniref:DUF6221 family protein n=1 Tax=Streptomyces sp. CS131 TaxID=2162711 RepID=UPI001EF45C70|nr:DUF6221 family protein [Streptomyces sp. CS131]